MEIAMKFDAERKLWEKDLRRMKESFEIRTKELEISQSNCEKLPRKFIAEIEQWKQRNSKLELNLQEMRQIEANLTEYESKISSLLQENEMFRSKFIAENSKNKGLENKIVKISEELEQLTVISNKKLEENDALKQKCNRLEVLCTEMRVNEMKLRQFEEDNR